MSQTAEERVWERLGLDDGLTDRDVYCRYCKAKVGEWCTVEGSTRMAAESHDARRDRLAGYREGLLDARLAVTALLKKKAEAPAEQEATG